jgi:hypothetical protein
MTVVKFPSADSLEAERVAKEIGKLAEAVALGMVRFNDMPDCRNVVIDLVEIHVDHLSEAFKCLAEWQRKVNSKRKDHAEDFGRGRQGD